MDVRAGVLKTEIHCFFLEVLMLNALLVVLLCVYIYFFPALSLLFWQATPITVMALYKYIKNHL